MPAAAQLAPRPAWPRSKTSTGQPAAASFQPIPSPHTPPPMIATLGKDCIGRSVKRDITGSLRWNDPDQVPWVCSQPPAVGTTATIQAYLDYRPHGWDFKPENGRTPCRERG